MHAPKRKTWTTSASEDVVFAALVKVVEEGKYTVVAEDRPTLAFASGKTAFSWGQEYVAEVHRSGDRTELVLVCGGVDGAPKALMDGWKNNKAADKVLAAVAAAVDAGGATVS